MSQQMSLVAFNNQIRRYSETHHVKVNGAVVNAKAGTVTFKKMVLTPIEIYKEIQMLKYEAKYSQYGDSSSGEDF